MLLEDNRYKQILIYIFALLDILTKASDFINNLAYSY